MDAIKEISFTHRFWVFLLPLVLMAAEVQKQFSERSKSTLFTRMQQVAKSRHLSYSTEPTHTAFPIDGGDP